MYTGGKSNWKAVLLVFIAYLIFCSAGAIALHYGIMLYRELRK